MKIFKQLAIVTVVAIAALCMSIFAAACTKATDYTVTVYYSDGTTVVDGTKTAVIVQICDASGKFCFIQTPTVDAQGKVSFKIADVDAAADTANVTEKTYVLHAWLNGTELELTQDKVTVNSDNPDAKLVLKTVTVPAA